MSDIENTLQDKTSEPVVEIDNTVEDETSEPIVEIDNLQISFDNHEVLKDVTLKLYTGENL